MIVFHLFKNFDFRLFFYEYKEYSLHFPIFPPERQRTPKSNGSAQAAASELGAVERSAQAAVGRSQVIEIQPSGTIRH